MKIFIPVVFFFIGLSVCANDYFVATDGSDSNNGQSVDTPFKTITKAISVIQPGDVIYVRGGVYPNSSTITISKSGTPADTCFLLAYSNERPVLDFSGTSFGSRGIKLTGSYWHIKGFDFIKAGDNGMQISGGGNNLIEFCSFYENKDTGLQISSGAHDNTILNCDSYYNADPTDYGDADGFAPKLDVGTNNRFIGCRAWGNCDDGWDGYMRGATNVTTILENCWTWGNGYLKDGTNPGSQANGNGFKMGGGDNSNSQNLTHHFFLSNCVAFYNKAKGFDQNNNVGTMQLLNCTGYKNLSANYRIKKELVSGETLTVKNCVSFDGKTELGSFAVEATNSWMAPFSLTEDDFITLDTSGVSAPRKADGSLPDVQFVHLASGSDLINSGTEVGLPFLGSAPDLGAFEYDPNTGINLSKLDKDLVVYFSGNNLNIHNYQSDKEAKLRLYNLNGQMLFESIIQGQSVQLTPGILNNGVYLVELENQESRLVSKVVKSNFN